MVAFRVIESVIGLANIKISTVLLCSGYRRLEIFYDCLFSYIYTIKCDTSHQPKGRKKWNWIELKSIEPKCIFFNIDCDIICTIQKNVWYLFSLFRHKFYVLWLNQENIKYMMCIQQLYNDLIYSCRNDSSLLHDYYDCYVCHTVLLITLKSPR